MTPQYVEITMSPQLNELFGALSKAQSTIEFASKDKSNPFHKSKYADLASIWEACRSSLCKNGLSIIQIPQNRDDKLFLVSILGHSSGQWIRGEVEIPLAKKDPQSIGSAITYFRRYMLSAMVGVAPNDDDDGEKAQSQFRKQEVHSRTSHANPTLVRENEQSLAMKISPSQVEEFQFILSECDKGYQIWFYDYIHRHYNTKNIADLPFGIYGKMKENALKNMNDNHAKQKEEFVEPVLATQEAQ